MDGRNPEPKKPWNDDDPPVNTNKQWLSMVSERWCDFWISQPFTVWVPSRERPRRTPRCRSEKIPCAEGAVAEGAADLFQRFEGHGLPAGSKDVLHFLCVEPVFIFGLGVGWGGGKRLVFSV